MNVIDWEKFWKKVDERTDEIADAFQQEMALKHGMAHYYMSGEEYWDRQKAVIQDVIVEEFKR